MSDNLERFKRDFLEANTWPQRKDGVPFYLLDPLTPVEREIAEDMLMDALSLRDTWPARGLGHIHSTKALPALYGLLEQSNLNTKVNIAHAIYQINGDSQMVEVVLDEFPKITNEYVLTDALHLLPIFRDPRITTLLEDYTRDSRYLVVYNATVALGRSTDEVVRRFRKMHQKKNQKKNWWQRVLGGQ